MRIVVAITRLAPNAVSEAGRSAEAKALAPATGIGIYELRVALGGALPLIIAHHSEQTQPRRLLDALHARGYGAVACDEATVVPSGNMFAPREFVIERTGLTGVVNPSTSAQLPWSDVGAVIAATRLRSETSTVDTSEKQFSLGRAALTGGLSMSRTVKKTERRSHDERESVLYLLRRDGSDHWLLAGSHLRYGGLGDRCAPAAHQNFQTLQEISYAHTPGALHDDRLMKQQRAPGTLVAAKAGTVTAMNLDAVDLAVHLLATAHAQGQL